MKAAFGNTLNLLSSQGNLLLNSFQNKKQLTSYLNKPKRNEILRSASYNKRPGSGNIAISHHRPSSGSAKRK